MYICTYVHTYLSTFDRVGESNVERSGDLLEGVLLVVHHQINYRCKVEAAIREAPPTGVGLDGNHLHILKSTTLKGRKTKAKQSRVKAGKTSVLTDCLLDNKDVGANVGTGVSNKEGAHLHTS